MTGTGTQADPYIVSTWEDFVTAIGTEQAYVEFPENTIIDMNDIIPEGIGEMIYIKCTQFDAKGGEIKNLFFKHGGRFLIQNSNWNTYIKNLKLINMRADDTGFRFFTYGEMRNCVISGSFGGEDMFDLSSNRFVLESCSVNAQLQSGTKFTTSQWDDERSLNVNNSIINLSGVVRSDGGTLVLNNSLLQGKIPTNYFYTFYNSLIDCIVPANTSLGGHGYSGDKGYINSSKFGEGVTTSKQYILVTNEQLQDTNYLFDIGFPIGVD